MSDYVYRQLADFQVYVHKIICLIICTGSLQIMGYVFIMFLICTGKLQIYCAWVYMYRQLINIRCVVPINLFCKFKQTVEFDSRNISLIKNTGSQIWSHHLLLKNLLKGIFLEYYTSNKKIKWTIPLSEDWFTDST